jgi:hypothetical protein
MLSYSKAQLTPLIENLRRRWREAINRQIEKRVGLLPIGDTRPEDVFICGYPKSGNTWFQYIAAALVYGTDPEIAPYELIADLVPDVHQQRYYRRYGSACLFKSHELPKPTYRRVVYLLRDGRDAMVSYYRYLEALSGPVDFRELVTTRGGLPAKWHEHVEAFDSNPHGAEMIVLRYEDLRRDTVAQMRRFCDFMGLDRSDAALRQVADATSFEKMRVREQRSGWSTYAWPKDKAFVRRGVVGSFKDEMPAPVLDAFLKEALPALIAHGYVIDGADRRAER